LLIGLDGIEKMSKSLDNYIGIDEPADIMFEKCMKVPDSLLGDYFRLTTDVPQSDYLPVMQTDMYAAHFLYASSLTAIYHGEDAAASAKVRYEKVASGNMPVNMDEKRLAAGEYPLFALVAATGLSQTSSEARRLIKEGGISVDGQRKTDPVESRDYSGNVIIKRGKGKFVNVVFE
jgi:tyrosyl-tRNA synthetase